MTGKKQGRQEGNGRDEKEMRRKWKSGERREKSEREGLNNAPHSKKPHLQWQNKKTEEEKKKEQKKQREKKKKGKKKAEKSKKKRKEKREEKKKEV